jgi:N-acetylmuramoyl-L-alanine amidase
LAINLFIWTPLLGFRIRSMPYTALLPSKGPIWDPNTRPEDPHTHVRIPAAPPGSLRPLRIRGLVVLALAAVLAGATLAASSGGPPRPRIVWKPIPFGAKRRAETASYSKRHYGTAEWRLRRPRVIVEHYTATNSFSSPYNTFAADVPDSELHELPGTCAHFIIDTDGTIYQLVNLATRCRHTVGLNYTAIGIEHVGMSDQQILGNRRQLAASLRLTLWLSQKYRIKLKNVIGHNESVTSPYHKELYQAWRCQTHGDWTYADMTIYRGKLRSLARKYAIDMGRLPAAGHSSC